MISVPDKVREAGLLRLKNRTARFHRLVKINAPTVIVARELHLLANALWLLDPDAMAEIKVDQEHGEARNRAGFCAIDTCSNFISKDTKSIPGVLQTCPDCTIELNDDDEDSHICQQCWKPYPKQVSGDGEFFCSDSCKTEHGQSGED